MHAPVLVDGAWQFSEAWLEEFRAELERGIEAADPLDPGVNAPVEPWAAEVLARLPFERRGSKLYRAGLGASLGEREAEAARLEAELEAAAPAPVKVEDAELARFLERNGRLIRLGDGYAVSAAAYERARALVVEECESCRPDCARPLPRSRRLRPPRRPVRCSSVSTRTGSRAESATSECSDVRRHGQREHVRPVVVAGRVEALACLEQQVRIELGVEDPLFVVERAGEIACRQGRESRSRPRPKMSRPSSSDASGKSSG